MSTTVSGNTINWPYDPNDPIPNIPNGQGMTPQQQLAALEQAMNFLENNPNSPYTYNASIATLQLLMTMGSEYNEAGFPQEQFQQVLNGMSGSNGSQFFNDVVQNVMEGAFFLNGASGFAQTNAFINNLNAQLSQLSKISPLFANLDTAGSTMGALLEQVAESSWVLNSNGQTFLTSGGNNPVIMDFAHFLQMATQTLGNDLNPQTPAAPGAPSVQNALDAYYKAEADSIVSQFGNDPSLAIFLLMMLIMNGQAPDLTRQINGYGNQLQSLNNQQGLVDQLLSTLRNIPSGPAGAQSAQQFMQNLSQLKQSIDELDPALAPTVDQAINSLLSGNVPLTANSASQFYASAPTTTGGVYVFPPGDSLPTYNNGSTTSIFYTYTLNGQTVTGTINSDNSPTTSTTVYLPPGSVIQLVGNMGGCGGTTINVPLSFLGGSDTYNSGGTSTSVTSGLGDWNDIATYLNGAVTNPQNGILQTIQSAQTVIAGQSPQLNTLITADTNLMNTLLGFANAYMTNAVAVEQQVNTNLQQSNT